MALLKALTDSNGVVTNYHKISHVDLHHGRVFCGVDSYVSKEYRNLEARASSSHFEFSITVEEEESMGIRALCYKKIKARKEWSDATDC